MIGAIPSIVCSLAFAGLGYFVWLHKPRNNVKLIFSALCLVTFYWQMVFSISFFTSDSQYLDYLSKVAYVGILFLPFIFYHFIIEFLGLKKERKIVVLYYGVALVLTFLLPSNLVVTGHQKFAWGNFAAPGPMYPIYMISALVIMLRGVLLLRQAVSNPSAFNVGQNQVHYVFLGLGFYFLCAPIGIWSPLSPSG